MDTTKLLRKIVAIPSISKNEANLSAFIYDYLKECGLSPTNYKDNVYCSIGKERKGCNKPLLFNSHLDTVPVCPGWKTSPFKPRERESRLYGLGANDAKASIASMINAVVQLADSKELGGNVYFAASVQEETLNIGIQQLMEKIPNVGAVVIGEPTSLDICASMRGLVILKFTTRGKSAHASRPSEGANAIYKAMNDIEKIKNIRFQKKHSILGYPSIAITMINGGIKSNMIPAECEFTADVRTTPLYNNLKIIEMIKKVVKGEVSVISSRLIPKETREDEKVVIAARKANPAGHIIGFRAMCDWVFVDAPGIIMGPGRTWDSHSPNESVDLRQVEKAGEIYQRLAIEYFR